MRATWSDANAEEIEGGDDGVLGFDAGAVCDFATLLVLVETRDIGGVSFDSGV